MPVRRSAASARSGSSRPGASFFSHLECVPLGSAHSLINHSFLTFSTTLISNKMILLSLIALSASLLVKADFERVAYSNSSLVQYVFYRSKFVSILKDFQDILQGMFSLLDPCRFSRSESLVGSQPLPNRVSPLKTTAGIWTYAFRTIIELGCKCRRIVCFYRVPRKSRTDVRSITLCRGANDGPK